MNSRTVTLSDKDYYQQILENCLSDWKEVALVVIRFLLWKNPIYGWVLGFLVSTIYLYITITNPSVLTFLACIALITLLISASLPAVNWMFFADSMWTRDKKEEFDDAIDKIATFIVSVTSMCHYVWTLKIEKPSVFYPVSIASMTILAWLGSTVSNYVINFFLVTAVFMGPGLVQHGYAANLYHQGSLLLSNFLHQLVKPRKD